MGAEISDVRGTEGYVPSTEFYTSSHGHIHRVITIILASLPILTLHATISANKEFSSNFWSNISVAPDEQQIQQRFPLIFGDFIAIGLSKDQQALVPEHGQFGFLASQRFFLFAPSEAQEVEDKSINYLVWKGIFLAQQDSNENVDSSSCFAVDVACLLGAYLT